MVAYERWSFTIGSEYSNLSGKSLEFWIGGHLWEVVAHGGSTVLPVAEFTRIQREYLC